MTETLADQPIIVRQARWPSVAMIVGGAVMIALWPIYTTLHGPTSVNQGGELLGRDPLFWGAMMEGPPLLLMAAGLFGSRRLLTETGGRKTRVGLVLALIALVIPALANLAILAVWPPLLAPLLGVGLILLGSGQPDGGALRRPTKVVLIGMGITQVFSFLWALVVRPDVIDQINGYRIAGVVANVLFGLGWIVLGVSLLHANQPSEARLL